MATKDQEQKERQEKASREREERERHVGQPEQVDPPAPAPIVSSELEPIPEDERSGNAVPEQPRASKES